MRLFWKNRIPIMITVAALVVFFVAGCKKNPELPEDPYVPVYDQGSGTNEDPWLISNAEQLDSIRNNLSAHYRLIADIDLGDYLADTPWVPIGDESNNFNGVLDGNNHTITGLTLSVVKSQSRAIIAFFRCTGEAAEIRNMFLDNVCIHGTGYGTEVIAALVGINKGEIKDCSVLLTTEGYMSQLGGLVSHNKGVITSCRADVDMKYWPARVGGLVYSNEGSIHDCYTSGTITGEQWLDAGGMVLENWSTISECHSSVDIINTNQTKGSVGGFVGEQSTSGTIRESYSTGNIELVISSLFDTFSDALTVGGFVGGCYLCEEETIENSYTTGNVLVTIGAGNFSRARITIGGFSGGGSDLTNCYAAGKVTGINTGGLVGADNVNAKVISSYYDSETTGQNDTGNGIPKTSMEMMQQATFEGWDFTSVWTIDEGTSYPFLQWQ